MQWYYPPETGVDLSNGFDQFDKHDNSKDEHIDSLLKTIMAHEQEEGKKIDAQVVTWRGMMTKVLKKAPIYYKIISQSNIHRSCRLRSRIEMGV